MIVDFMRKESAENILYRAFDFLCKSILPRQQILEYFSKQKMNPINDPYFLNFERPIDAREIPARFTFPFYYTPHHLAEEASRYLMSALENGHITPHNFGLHPGQEKGAIGKMFGILVVQRMDGQIGYLRAFSGKINNSNQLEGFVPPIFDTRDPGGFYVQGEEELIRINEEIWAIERHPTYLQLMQKKKGQEIKEKEEIAAWRETMRLNRKIRKEEREQAKHTLSQEEYALLEQTLIKKSLQDQWELKQLQKKLAEEMLHIDNDLAPFLRKIENRKAYRKKRSNGLQQQLFEQYNFLNIEGESKNVKDIFAEKFNLSPPAGAGECATPKLLQHAFSKGYRPLCMAEFWWGASPASEVRRHKQFYPACRGKCEPILGFMLEGMETDPNPMTIPRTLAQDLKTVYEDEYIVVVDKPAEMLSVPGKHQVHDVQSILRERYPNATGPILVHRLDMSTSGLMIGGKTKEVHQNLQAQFIKRTVHKRYSALLDGKISLKKGTISLPLRVDLDNRPQQLVCYHYGKPAETCFELVEEYPDSTKVWLYPITGRTHQLRVHMAHHEGLGTPIKGDDLYGNKADRLYLHASVLEITHPINKKRIRFESVEPF